MSEPDEQTGEPGQDDAMSISDVTPEPGESGEVTAEDGQVEEADVTADES